MSNFMFNILGINPVHEKVRLAKIMIGKKIYMTANVFTQQKYCTVIKCFKMFFYTPTIPLF